MSDRHERELREYVRRLEAERAELRARLDEAHHWVAETRAAAESVRPLLRSMQESRFWKVRNAWFELKKRLGMHPDGAQAPVDLILSEYDPLASRATLWERWRRANDLRPSDAQALRDAAAALARTPRISVLMPVYDTPERYLRAALDSVRAQLYPHWELCVADDASSEPHVRSVLEEYRAADERVKVVYRETNGHIAQASNSALALATGELVALLDHDDVLAPDALFHVALLLNARPDDRFRSTATRTRSTTSSAAASRTSSRTGRPTRSSRACTRGTSASSGARWWKRSAASAPASRAARTTTSCCASPSARSASSTSRACSTTGASIPSPRRRTRSRSATRTRRDAARSKKRSCAAASPAAWRSCRKPAATSCATRSAGPKRSA